MTDSPAATCLRFTPDTPGSVHDLRYDVLITWTWIDHIVVVIVDRIIVPSRIFLASYFSIYFFASFCHNQACLRNAPADSVLGPPLWPRTPAANTRQDTFARVSTTEASSTVTSRSLSSSAVSTLFVDVA